MDIKWDYTNFTRHVTMDGYIADVLLKYKHTKPAKPQYALHKHRKIVYGAKQQLTPDIDAGTPLNNAGIKHIQGAMGSLLYYAQANDNKLLMALSAIGMQQAKATTTTLAAVNQLLDFLATYPVDGITYQASNMILTTHSPAPTSFSQRTIPSHRTTDLSSQLPNLSSS